MELFKVRGFSAFFTDTFQFLKEHAKHFFTNYFIINGVFLILSFVKNYLTGIGYTFPAIFEFLTILVILVFSVINWTFVPIYMILYTQRKTDFNYRDILQYLKDNIGKVIIYILVSILLAIPIIIGFYIAAIILMFTIVGILLIPLLYAALFLWFTLGFYEYLYNDNKPVFDCFGYGFTLFYKKFWATTGSVALLFVVMMIVYGLLASATGIIGTFMDFNWTDVNSIVNLQKTFLSPAMLVVGTVLSILMVTIQINQGVIYFSQKENLENIKANEDIDLIGKLGE